MVVMLSLSGTETTKRDRRRIEEEGGREGGSATASPSISLLRTHT